MPAPTRTSTSLFASIGLAAAMMMATAGGLLAHGYGIGDIEIDHPWSRETPAGAKVAAGYAVVRNKSSEPDRLVSVTAEIAEKAEIHEMSMTDGVMSMRPLPDGIEIPAGAEVRLEPGSFHLMFIGLNRQPKQGERFGGTMTFEKAGTVSVEFEVDAKAGGNGTHTGHGS
jgi:periplasmic copper chaperone A